MNNKKIEPVEIDESKFAKRKYHQEHPVKSGWVFGGIERGSDGKKAFLASVPHHSSKFSTRKLNEHQINY